MPKSLDENASLQSSTHPLPTRRAVHPVYGRRRAGKTTLLLNGAEQAGRLGRQPGSGFGRCLAAKRQAIPEKYRIWIEVRKRYRLSDAQVQMARERGLNPRKFGKLANEKKEP